jgi:hypothetical protein
MRSNRATAKVSSVMRTTTTVEDVGITVGRIGPGSNNR